MSGHNIPRNNRFARKSIEELATIYVRGSLGSACAHFHLFRKFIPAQAVEAIERATKSKKRA